MLHHYFTCDGYLNNRFKFDLRSQIGFESVIGSRDELPGTYKGILQMLEEK